MALLNQLFVRGSCISWKYLTETAIPYFPMHTWDSHDDIKQTVVIVNDGIERCKMPYVTRREYYSPSQPP